MANKRQLAKSKGYYTQGKSMFKIRQGDVIPDNIDDIFYYDAENPEEHGTGLAQRRINQFAAGREEVTTDEPDEEITTDASSVEVVDDPAADEATTTAEEEIEATDKKPARGASKGK